MPDYKIVSDYRAAACCLLCEYSQADGVTGLLRCDIVGNKVDATCVCNEFKEMAE
jgi:hypothetical protein